jgi:deoxyadenosine/deoxycytidine kinase
MFMNVCAQRNKNKKMIVIIGNIGSGKSTLVKEIDGLTNHRFTTALEPFEEWKQSGLFTHYADEKHKYALPMQLYILQSRLAHFMKALKQNEALDVIYKEMICDGHALTDYNVFTKHLHEQGYLTQVDMKFYTAVYRDVQSMVPELFNPSVIFFLDASPELCMKRIQERGRTDEVGKLTTNYIESIDKKHREFIRDTKHKVVRLDARLNPCELAEQMLNHM